MKSVFAVNTGSYSDYRIVAIFSSKKLAEEFMAAVPDSEYNDIAEYELNPKTADLIRRGYFQWRVLMLKDGTVEKTSRQNVGIDNMGTWHALWERTNAPACEGMEITGILSSSVLAKTEKQAIKIANDRRVQMIALGEW